MDLTLLSMAMVCHAAPAPSYELYNYGASCVSTKQLFKLMCCVLVLQIVHSSCLVHRVDGVAAVSLTAYVDVI